MSAFSINETRYQELVGRLLPAVIPALPLLNPSDPDPDVIAAIETWNGLAIQKQEDNAQPSP